MAILVTDRRLEERLKAEREASGADRYDEVWEGVYMMAPMPNSEHQGLVIQLASILQEVIGWSGLADVFPGINLSAQDDDWEHDYRVPDVADFLKSGSAVNCDTHWRGAADFLVEITSPEDRTREKIPFYSRIGVVELLLVDRESWTLELYGREKDQLQRVGQSSADAGEVLTSTAVPLSFELVSGDPRPRIKVTHVDSGREWMV
ncbi:MAG: Uma2 family endonuclease [Planctomycetota bacterium]|jgi:Uma2 family endonuclease